MLADRVTASRRSAWTSTTPPSDDRIVLVWLGAGTIQARYVNGMWRDMLGAPLPEWVTHWQEVQK